MRVRAGDLDPDLDVSTTSGPADLEFVPIITRRCPDEDWVDAALPGNLAIFAFPEGCRLARGIVVSSGGGSGGVSSVAPPPPTYFNFVLTYENATKLHCVAVVSYEPLGEQQLQTAC